jgi:hypothetical protein
MGLVIDKLQLTGRYLSRVFSSRSDCVCYTVTSLWNKTTYESQVSEQRIKIVDGIFVEVSTVVPDDKVLFYFFAIFGSMAEASGVRISLSIRFNAFSFSEWNCVHYMYVCVEGGVHIHVYSCSYIIQNIHTYINPYIQTNIHTYIQIYIHTNIHTYIHTHTPKHINI